MTTIKITHKGTDIYADDADNPNLVVINGTTYTAVDDTDTESACADCALLTKDCGPVKCGNDERTDGRDVHFTQATTTVLWASSECTTNGRVIHFKPAQS